MFKKLIFLICIGFITFGLLEVTLMFASKLGIINILMPTYDLNPHEDFLPLRSYIYGHQHLPNSTYRVKKYCLDSHYEFNELGFRDQLQNKSSKNNRVIVIGDSFMEGVGVKESERLGDLLEKQANIPHLNFAMADKGTTQSFLIYDSIAKKFDHQAVLWSIFPTNDLIDDDPKFGKNIYGIKPCWSGSYPNYELKFFPSEAPKEKSNIGWKRFLKSYTYTYDALFYLKENLKLKFSEQNNYPKTGYFNYTNEQLNRMKFSIKQLKKSAGDIPIKIICIPSTIDLDSNTSKTKQNIEIPLKAFCKQLDIEFYGLYDLFATYENSTKLFYYDCDSHWNPNGHEFVAKHLIEKAYN